MWRESVKKRDILQKNLHALYISFIESEHSLYVIACLYCMSHGPAVKQKNVFLVFVLFLVWVSVHGAQKRFVCTTEQISSSCSLCTQMYYVQPQMFSVI